MCAAERECCTVSESVVSAVVGRVSQSVLRHFCMCTWSREPRVGKRVRSKTEGMNFTQLKCKIV